VALGGRQSTIAYNNQTNQRGGDGGGIVQGVGPTGNAGGAAFDHSVGGRVGRGERII